MLSQHTDDIVSKFNLHLCWLRVLKQVSVDNGILEQFYLLVITSVITYCIVCCDGNEIKNTTFIWKAVSVI